MESIEICLRWEFPCGFWGLRVVYGYHLYINQLKFILENFYVMTRHIILTKKSFRHITLYPVSYILITLYPTHNIVKSSACKWNDTKERGTIIVSCISAINFVNFALQMLLNFIWNLIFGDVLSFLLHIPCNICLRVGHSDVSIYGISFSTGYPLPPWSSQITLCSYCSNSQFNPTANSWLILFPQHVFTSFPFWFGR